MKRSWFAIPVLVCALVVPACSSSSPSEPMDTGRVKVVSLGETFALSPGEGAVVRPGGEVLTFVELVRESRCPIGALCVVAGDAELRMRLRLSDGRVETLTAFAPPRPNNIPRAGGLIIDVMDLEPYPRVGAPPPAAGSYRVTLSVSAG